MHLKNIIVIEARDESIPGSLSISLQGTGRRKTLRTRLLSLVTLSNLKKLECICGLWRPFFHTDWPVSFLSWENKIFASSDNVWTPRHLAGEVKLHTWQGGPHGWSWLGLCSRKQLRAFLLPLGGILVHRSVTPSSILPVPICTPAFRWTIRCEVSCLRKQHVDSDWSLNHRLSDDSFP